MGNYTRKLPQLRLCGLVLIIILGAQLPSAYSLSASFYDQTCPQAQAIVHQEVMKAFQNEKRIAASLLRMHFHDCFVQGCDGSVLLDNTDTTLSEKDAAPNIFSLRGFDVVDDMKAAVESSCLETVSCADILAIAARDSIVASGGPYYEVLLGRRDSLTANKTAAALDLPGPNSNASSLLRKFQYVGLTEEDMVTLSGAHTIGKSRCTSFRNRLYNQSATGYPDPALSTGLLSTLQDRCPRDGDSAVENKTVYLDQATPETFDNQYYKNLLSNQGILYSDQLMSTCKVGNVEDLVKCYAADQYLFFYEFAKAMIKMGNISPLTGTDGQIRKHCRVINS